MAGYATSALLRGHAPHLAVRPASSGSDSWAAPELDGWARSAPEDLVGRPLDHALADWLASVGESWSQLTFFLFDPDSWR